MKKAVGFLPTAFSAVRGMDVSGLRTGASCVVGDVFAVGTGIDVDVQFGFVLFAAFSIEGFPDV